MKIKTILVLISLFLIDPRSILAQIPRTSTVITGPNSSYYSSVHLPSLVTTILFWVFDIVGILSFVWAFIGVFQYITAGGNKEALAKARGRMTWVFVGLLFLTISFALYHYVLEVFRLTYPDVPATLTPF